GPGGRAEEQSLQRFRAANPQALIVTTGPGNTSGGSFTAYTAFTAFTHDHPAVPDGLGPCGIVPVEDGDTTRAARRAAIAAVLARHHGLGHLDTRQAGPLLAALDLTHQEREAFLTSCLGPLHNSARHRHLLETLEAYLAHNLCTTAAARSLYVHRHTFAYRMRSVRALTGLDPDRPYHRLRAELALLMSRVHGSPAVPRQRTAAA
ncbi:PucR family transcriptional regulator, partial [Streptomyces lycii]